MENKQTIVVDEELLAKVLEIKVEEFLAKKASSLDQFIARTIRVKIEDEIANTKMIRESISKELDATNPKSLLSNAIAVKAASSVNSKIVEIPQIVWRSIYTNAVKNEVMKNSSVASLLHPMLTEIIQNDPQFKKTLQKQVELSLKAKIEKFLNKTAHSL